MLRFNILLLTVCLFLATKSKSDLTCGQNNQTFKMSIQTQVNEQSVRVTTLSAETDSIDLHNSSRFDVVHEISECNGRRVVRMQGVAKEIEHDLADKLYFHLKFGKNAALVGNGRTAQKINLEDPHNSVTFTNRPLKNGEVFEVRLDKKNTKFSHSLGIGVTSSSPDSFAIPPQMHLLPNAWIMHNDQVYSNGKVVLDKYGKTLNNLKEGETVGVMRSRFGVLHFFVNGVDQGPAVPNIPEKVYGVFELWNNAVKGTIVDHHSSS